VEKLHKCCTDSTSSPQCLLVDPVNRTNCDTLPRQTQIDTSDNKAPVRLYCIRCDTGAGQSAATTAVTGQPAIDSVPSSLNGTALPAIENADNGSSPLRPIQPNFDYSSVPKCDNGTKPYEYSPGKQAVCQQDNIPCPPQYLCITGAQGYGTCCPNSPELWSAASGGKRESW
jgi:hypothetical protein